jgi:cytochrome c2
MRRRIALPLVLVCPALAIAGCGGGSGAGTDPARLARGRDVFMFDGCASCHGPDTRGGKSAPPLEKLGRHWSAAELSAYLRSPRTYPKDSRLIGIGKHYPADMAGVPTESEERMGDLIAFLLSR